jgi:hypothetical protein
MNPLAEFTLVTYLTDLHHNQAFSELEIAVKFPFSSLIKEVILV